MTLFDLALLADVVHLLHLTYALLRDQCYFYADIIYTAIKQHFGVCYSEDYNENQNNLIFVDGSCLSNKYGCYKGVMINRSNPLAIDLYKATHAKEMHAVILCPFKSKINVTYYYILRRCSSANNNADHYHDHNYNIRVDHYHWHKLASCKTRSINSRVVSVRNCFFKLFTFCRRYIAMFTICTGIYITFLCLLSYQSTDEVATH
jgi:hypothetical protein